MPDVVIIPRRRGTSKHYHTVTDCLYVKQMNEPQLRDGEYARGFLVECPTCLKARSGERTIGMKVSL